MSLSSLDTERWYAVRVRSNHERVVQAALRYRGIEEYLPVYRKRSRWSDRTRDIDVPLFPGYVFGRFDPARRAAVLVAPGVVQVLGDSSGPLPIDNRELESVRRFVDSCLAVTPWPYVAVGDRVLVEHGPLAGQEGILLRVKDSLRLVVSLTLLQRSVAVEVDRDWVRPLGSQAQIIGALYHQFRLEACGSTA
ncbi:MAG: transcription termination/antitermination protein NusG [Bryobacteraceae bacterium]